MLRQFYNKEKGISLTEVIIAATLLSIVVGATVALLLTSLDDLDTRAMENSFRFRSYETVRSLMQPMKSNLFYNIYRRPNATATNTEYILVDTPLAGKNYREGDCFEFREPDYEASSKSIEWTSGSRYIRFNRQTNLDGVYTNGSLVREQDLDKDLDQDGNKTDSFHVGYIEQVLQTAPSGPISNKIPDPTSGAYEWKRVSTLPVLYQLDNNFPKLFHAYVDDTGKITIIDVNMLFYSPSQEKAVWIKRSIQARN